MKLQPARKNNRQGKSELPGGCAGVDSQFGLIAEEGLRWLVSARRELLLFAAFWLIVGAIDELAIDLRWLWLRLRGRLRTGRLPEGLETAPLTTRAAVLIAAWQEADVIGPMIAHTLRAWVQRDFVLFLGVYRNDPATLAAALAAAPADHRLRIVIHDRDGPTTKADCLNRLYVALCEQERLDGRRFGSVVLHDAEDMVHPAALAVLDAALADAAFVQLPVRPEPQPDSPWVAGHYADEFAESHAKDLVVRDSVGAGIPSAGVGCAFARDAIEAVSRERRRRGESGPFAADCLTEDYELGLLVARHGGRGRFLRLRDGDGRLVATRAYFPADFDAAVRQKTRWIHGISLQGWDRLGWSPRLVDNWMALRDRRGPLTALVLASAYLLILVQGVIALAGLFGHGADPAPGAGLDPLLTLCLASLVWRSAFRFALTAREYGAAEGLRAVLRIPVANLIAILAGRRALFAYVRTLLGGEVRWDKTAHHRHPATEAST